MQKIPSRIRKAPKRKPIYSLKKSTDPGSPAQINAGQPPPAQADGALDGAIDKFREETKGSGAGFWEFVASQE
ncbi:MAG: hypothetical protein HQ568_02495 [Calditrichaeota bacterium]|nr:hypothetical protein [Calditrichota bacterium]